MATERTFSIIKPDATARNLTGQIIARFEEAGVRIVASKRIHMTREQAEGFYAVHKERPFFNDLVSFMISGPVVVQVLEGDNAIMRNREIMGATNPAEADAGTSGKILPRALKPIPCMGLMPPKPPPKRLNSSLPMRKLSVKSA